MMREVWDYSRTRGSARLMMLALADNANDETRETFPSLTYLARKCNCSYRQARFLITRCEELGELVVLERPGTSSIYRIREYNGLDERLERYPDQGKNVKDVDRQRAIHAKRPKKKARKSPARTGKGGQS